MAARNVQTSGQGNGVCVSVLERDGGGGGVESPGDKIFERLQMWDVSAA